MDKFQNKYRIPSARMQNWNYGSDGAYFITICTHNREHYFGENLGGEMQLNNIGKFAEQFWLAIPQYFSFAELGNFVIMPNHTHGILIIDKNANVPNVDANATMANWMMGNGTMGNGTMGNGTAANGMATNATMGNGMAANATMANATAANGTAANGTMGNVMAANATAANGTAANATAANGTAAIVETRLIASLPPSQPTPQPQPQPQPKKPGGFAGNKNPMPNDNISRIIRWYKGRCSFEIRKIYSNFEWQSRFHDHIIRNYAEFERIQNYITNNPLNWKEDNFYVHATPKSKDP